MRPPFFFLLPALALLFLLASCSFKYSEDEPVKYEYPELTFEDLRYTRMRDGKLVARLEAEQGDRYESKHLMELKNYSFEQFDSVSNKVDAVGDGGAATVDLVSNNVQMSNGVTIQVDSEDFSLRSSDLDWQDNKKILQSKADAPVNVRRSNGTDVHGTGFYSNIRTREWVFNTDVDGVYVLDEDEESNAPAAEKKEKT